MTAAAHPDALGLPFVLACLIVYFAAVLLIARFCGRGERLAERQRRAENLEVDHPFASIIDFAREREVRVQRATARHERRRSA